MKNRNLFILVMLILSFVLIVQIIVSGYKKKITAIKMSYDNLAIIKTQLDQIIQDQLILNGKPIDDWSLIDLNGKSISISEIADSKSCTFFIFNEFSCMDCINKSLEIALSNMNGRTDLVLICGYTNLLQVINWAKEYKVNGPIFLYQDYKDCIFSTLNNYPYLFRVTKDMKIINAISVKNNYDYINKYFKNLFVQ